MKKLIAGMLSLAILAAAALTGCNAGGANGSISISGSSALYPLVNVAAADFKTDNKDVSMSVQAGGSGTGLNNVRAKTVDIGMSDVYASEKPAAGFDDSALIDHQVCLIGVTVIVNADVGATVTNLTTDQLKGIFNGQTTNWQAVGGPDEDITVVNRPSSSGTRALFEKWALGGAASDDTAQNTDDSNQLMAMVGSTKGSIGYLALSYMNTAPATVSKVQLNGVDATNENIYNNSYPVWGYEHMYTNGEATGVVKAFIDYMTSPAMQTKAETLGYGAVAKLNAAAVASHKP
ncbi:MAG: phosphate ABC transporter substrate-binding protein [Oscillospiraceae bacterium]|nr:phosphate ABC transporter substrate-binding protein [Oscillospiraceae bacterium]